MSSNPCQIRVNRQIFNEEDFACSFNNNENRTTEENNRPLYKLRTFISRKGRECSCKDFLWSLFPILEWLPKYSLRQDLLADFTGGLTVGVMHIPQGLAFAMLASLPPVTGLYTALLPVLVYLLMGTSKYLSQGSFAVVCIMLAQVCEREAANMPGAASHLPLISNGDYNSTNTTAHTPSTLLWSPLDSRKLEVAISLAMLIGIMQVLMGIGRLGFLATYLSDPVISGFTTGSAVVVVISQLKPILGQSVPQITGIFSSVKLLVYMLRYIASSNPGAVITGVLAFALLVAMKYINERYRTKLLIPIPAELLVVVVGTAISYGAAINEEFDVEVLGNIPKGLPPISIPSFQLMRNLIPDAFVICMVIFATNMSLANMYAKKHGDTIDCNQELLAYGICNISASFFSSFPICNALARTAVQENLVHTQLCSIPVIILILLVLLFLAPLFFHLPKAILAAVVVANLIGLLRQFPRLRQLWNTYKVDAVVWFCTCFGVILLGVDLGLGFGLVVAFLSVVIRSSRPRYTILGHVKETELYRDITQCSQAFELPRIKIMRFESSLYFANANYFKSIMSFITGAKETVPPYQGREEAHVEDAVELPLKNALNTQEGDTEKEGGDARYKADQILAVILDASAFTMIDSVGAAALSTVITELKTRDVQVLLAACPYHLKRQLLRGGFPSHLHGNRFFVSVHDAVSYVLQAHTNIPA